MSFKWIIPSDLCFVQVQKQWSKSQDQRTVMWELKENNWCKTRHLWWELAFRWVKCQEKCLYMNWMEDGRWKVEFCQIFWDEQDVVGAEVFTGNAWAWNLYFTFCLSIKLLSCFSNHKHPSQAKIFMPCLYTKLVPPRPGTLQLHKVTADEQSPCVAKLDSPGINWISRLRS